MKFSNMEKFIAKKSDKCLITSKRIKSPINLTYRIINQ